MLGSDVNVVTPHEFQRDWCDDVDEVLIAFPTSSLKGVPFSEQTKSFLVDVGLPDSASPFLGFGPQRDATVPRLDLMWQLDSSFSVFWVIGSNGSGDPICIDTSDQDAVVYLNHDNRFCKVLMNSSLAQLATSLLAFRKLIRESQARNGEDAFLDGDIPADVKHELAGRLKKCDPLAYNPGCFWFDEVRAFDSMPS
jgi:hypothetical protein